MKRKFIIMAGVAACLVLVAAMFVELNAAPAGTKTDTKTPGVIILDTIEDMYTGVRFDHAKHTYMSDRCGQCHHQHNSGDEFSCNGCHALDSNAFKRAVVDKFMPCGSCHGIIQSSPGMKGLKVAYHNVCFGCHLGMGNLGNGPEGCAEMCHARKPQEKI